MTEVRYRVWGGQGKPDVWRPEEELRKRWDWRLLHPEFKRRLLALFVLSGHRIGFLSGARSASEQAQLYIERNGIGVARAGLSWHEDDSYEGFALAADLIGAQDLPGNELTLIDQLGPLVGLHDFSDVNREDWHVQPDEMPNSRSTYKANPAKYRLGVWALPDDEHTPPEPPEEDDMSKQQAVFVGATDGRQGLWLPGNPIQPFENPEQRNNILGYLDIDPNAGLTVSPGQFDRLS